VVVRDNMVMGALLDGFAHSMLSCRFSGNYETQVRAGAAVNLTQCLIVGSGEEGKEGVGVSICTAGRLDHCTIVKCQTGVVVEGGKASIRNSVLSQCTKDLLFVDGGAVPNFTLAKCVLGPGQVALGSTSVNTAQWADLVKATPRFADNAVEELSLAAPLYLLPAASPNVKLGDYGTTPGADAINKAYEGWVPVVP